MGLNKKLIQKEVDATINGGVYTEGLGKIILEFAEVSARTRGLNYRHSQFEVEFILKPRIVDMLLLKVFKYSKQYSSAYTFFSLVTSTAILDAIRDIKSINRSDTKDVYYIEDMKQAVMNLQEPFSLFDENDVYLDGNIIKLK